LTVLGAARASRAKTMVPCEVHHGRHVGLSVSMSMGGSFVRTCAAEGSSRRLRRGRCGHGAVLALVDGDGMMRWVTLGGTPWAEPCWLMVSTTFMPDVTDRRGRTCWEGLTLGPATMKNWLPPSCLPGVGHGHGAERILLRRVGCLGGSRPGWCSRDRPALCPWVARLVHEWGMTRWKITQCSSLVWPGTRSC